MPYTRKNEGTRKQYVDVHAKLGGKSIFNHMMLRNAEYKALSKAKKQGQL